MFLNLFYRLLFSHMCSDFLLQSNKLSKDRYSKDVPRRIRANAIHSLIHFTTALATTLPLIGWKSLILSLLLSSIHFVIDYLKSLLINKHPFDKYSISVFLTDQLLHLVTIVLICFTAASVSIGSITSFFYTDKMYNLYYTPLNIDEKLFLAASLLIFGSWGMGIYIKLFLGWLNMRNYKKAINLNIKINSLKDEHNGLDGGFIIGILERLFIISSIVLRLPEVIGFVLATKSIARFKKFDDDLFVEIFIIGSFISFISAIITGVIIRNLHI